MAHRLERARKMMGVFLPQCADELAAPLGVGLVPHGDVVLDEGDLVMSLMGANMA